MATIPEDDNGIPELPPIVGMDHLVIRGKDRTREAPTFIVWCKPGIAGRVMLHGHGPRGRMAAGLVVNGEPDQYACLVCHDSQGARALDLSQFFDYLEHTKPELIEHWPLARTAVQTEQPDDLGE